MTASTDLSVSSGRPEQPLGPLWRAEATAAQRRSLPAGTVTVSCPTRVGLGGLGRHLQEILEALAGRDDECFCICEDPADADAGIVGSGARRTLELSRAAAPLTRFSPAWRMWAASISFDRDAARRLTPAENLIAFNGTARAQFAAAPRAGMKSHSLVSANSHFAHVLRRHARAQRDYPGIERPWGTHLLRRNLAEYQRADRIYVASNYIRESFLQEGFDDSTLSFFPLTPDPRYRPRTAPRGSSTFDIVYVGSLMVHKGVPLLVEAFSRLPHADMRLNLVGGWSTRGMRRLIERACAADSRISAGPADPLQPINTASLCVHPSYEDGFAYAPAEALACGVPVLVSEDTGMKELIHEGLTGLVLPTGDSRALAEAIDAVYRRETLDGPGT
jgi:glycosyltransferase involved in cell wall biosynthesis